MPGQFCSGTVNEIITGFESNAVLSTINVEYFENKPLNEITNFKVLLDISHSWLGDIGVYLVCPDGTAIALHELTAWAGSNYDLTGCCYEITMDAEETILDATDGLEGPELPTGKYLPSDSFEFLLGCPIAGNWTLRIDESHPSDDVVLHAWCLIFGDSVYYEIGANLEETAIWNGPGLDSNDSLTSPDEPGIYSYSLFIL